MGELWERAAELEVLRSAVRGAATNDGSVVVISGEMGSGRTSLVRAFVREARALARVLVGHCDDLLTPRPFHALRDAVTGTGGPLEAALDSERVFDAVLAELTAAGPTVLVVEDVHWADHATLDVLGYVARRIAELPAVLVLTVRDGHSSERLHRTCGAAAGAPTHRLPLAPLSVDAVAALAAGSSWDGEELHALTGGNPFYVTETLARGDAVARLVQARLMQLTERGRGALERLSVVPGPIDLALAERLLGEDFASLHEAEEHGFLEVRHEGLVFRHELVRQAVESRVPRLRHLALHRDARALMSTSDTSLRGALTTRQRDVLRLLAEGLTNAEIAARLVVSVRTVDHHVSAVLRKLGVTSRRQAAAIATRTRAVPRGITGR